jgi:hypothetical protein
MLRHVPANERERPHRPFMLQCKKLLDFCNVACHKRLALHCNKTGRLINRLLTGIGSRTMAEW